VGYFILGDSIVLHRFSRTELLIGKDGLDILKNSKVAVFGIGGVGSFTVEALARAGVGNLVLIDFDEVALSNVNRQLHALQSTVGKPKVDLMKERVLDINPEINVSVIRGFYTSEKGASMISDDLDYIVDAIDNVTGKIDIIKRAVEKKIKIVSAMGAGNKLDPTAFQVADISQTSVCPLARVMRRELKNRGIVSGVRVVFSKEQPFVSHYAAEDFACSGEKQVPGSISFVPPVMGMILAGVVVKDLLGIGEKSHIRL
jgi:tRNA A37 threonylcarbamoyladenosine dehydratase